MSCHAYTLTGQVVDVLDPDPATLRIADMAVGIMREGRFANQTFERYSVMNHVLAGYDYLKECEYLSEFTRLAWLLHEFSEAYMRDLPRDLKGCVPDYRLLEDNLLSVVYSKYLGTTPKLSEYRFIDRESGAVCNLKMLDHSLAVSEGVELGSKQLADVMSRYSTKRIPILYQSDADAHYDYMKAIQEESLSLSFEKKEIFRVEIEEANNIFGRLPESGRANI